MSNKKKHQPNDGWKQVCGLLPCDWFDQAFELQAIGFVREFDPDSLLRTLVIYFCTDASLQDTAVTAQFHGIVKTSSMALHRRLRKSGQWLRWLAENVMNQNLEALPQVTGFNGRRVRIVDATTIQPPGSRQAAWRLHYSLLCPQNRCTEFYVTDDQTGETFRNFKIDQGDLLIGDIGYSHAAGIAHVVNGGGDVLVRINRTNLPVYDEEGAKIDLLSRLRLLRRGHVREIECRIKHDDQWTAGRVCALRLSKEAAARAKKRALHASRSKHHQTKPETLQAQEYLMVFTTLPTWEITARQVVVMYRSRWQVEVSFHRSKALFGIDQLPSKEPETARSWIYGKLLCGFLSQALWPDFGSFPPCGAKALSRAQWFGLAGIAMGIPAIGRYGPATLRSRKNYSLGARTYNSLGGSSTEKILS